MANDTPHYLAPNDGAFLHRIAILLIGLSLVAGQLDHSHRALAQAPNTAATPPIDDAKLRAAGIRKLISQHLVLYTDLPADPEIDRLPALFDQAVPQWAAYFGIDEAKTRSWQPSAFLIKDRKLFDPLGLMPSAGRDRFLNGISFGNQLWLYEQPSVYYRRHLLMHEGTHVFMTALLGSCGPGWYMEGTAEMMATHHIDEQSGRLTLRVMPADRDEVALHGRIKLVRDAFAAGRPLDLPAVMQIDNRRVLENEAYAWSWAACVFLDSHPRYRERFRGLKKYVLDVRFNEFVRRDFEADWRDLASEWAAFVATLDYGYDFERMAIDFRRGQPLQAAQRQAVTIAADRGWQSSGVWLAAGQEYKITASGRYQIAEETTDGKKQAWPCEPGGVTIDYYAGQPLGMLVGAIDARDAQNTDASLANPFPLGTSATIRPQASGTLYLRVNESAGRLNDNRGTLSIIVEAK